MDTNPTSAPESLPSLERDLHGELHVVVGAGATGTATALLLADRGAHVRVVTRSGGGPEHPSIERIAADASDAERLAELVGGAVALYNCANPPYHQWADAWPPLAKSFLQTAEATGAVLVTLSNLYGYAVDGPMRANQPLDPPSRKGAIRAQMWHDALAAHQTGRINAVEVRASDFIGPGLGDNGHMGDRLMRRIVAGKSVQVFGATDVEHSWTAINDVARTLVAVAIEPTAWGRAWHVPSVAPMTQQDLVHRLCETAEVAPTKVGVLPNAILAIAGLFVPPIREMAEMRYQFVEPFVIDASDTTAVFGLEATPLDETLRAMVDHTRGVPSSVPVAA